VFLDKEHGRGESRRARPNDTLFEHGGALGLQFVFLELGIAVRADCHWCCVGEEMNSVIIGLGGRQPLRHGEDVIE
jgi:hypothetical protein